MDSQNIRAVAAKDFESLRRKKSILGYVFGMPLIISVLFTLVVKNSIAPASGIPSDASLGLQSLVYFFVVFSAILPASIAAYSIVGEKVEKSLEPLLATPMSDGEILLGKTIAAFVPPVIAVWMGASIFMVASDFILRGPLGYYYFPNLNAGIMLLLLVPLAAIFSTQLAVIASSRLSDARSANQFAGVMFVPFMAIFLAAVEGFITFSINTLLIISAVVLVLDVVLFSISTSTFNREEILTKWE